MLAFKNYVLPILMYASPIWNPSCVRNKTMLEDVQRRFTKRLTGYRNKSYDQRLHDLKVMSLENRRPYADMLFTYKCIHKLFDCAMSDMGLFLSHGHTRRYETHLLQQHHGNVKAASMLKNRLPRTWNSLPLSITHCNSLYCCKKKLIAHIMNI